MHVAGDGCGDGCAGVRRCDIYCRVVDNFGDIGVVWRLARQLADEFGWRVRVVVDDLEAFRVIEPNINSAKPKQRRGSTEIFAWKCPPIGDSSDVVIEAFGCELPEIVVTSKAAQHPHPVWVNLEYLSAESWVTAHHLLPSRHPQLGFTKTFFFPGFGADTGGLLRERTVSLPSAPTNLHLARLKVFMFGYDLPGSHAVAAAVASSVTVASLTVPEGALARHLADANLPTLEVAAFVPQVAFDALLAGFDILLVRGEDSIVRAIWTGKPFVWQIYPQSDHAHWPKLEAFLSIYCRGLSPAAERGLRGLWHLLNDIPSETVVGVSASGHVWEDYVTHLPELALHAHNWAAAQMKLPDLASNLVAWVEKRSKTP